MHAKPSVLAFVLEDSCRIHAIHSKIALETISEGPKIQNFHGGTCPQTPLAGALRTHYHRFRLTKAKMLPTPLCRSIQRFAKNTRPKLTLTLQMKGSLLSRASFLVYTLHSHLQAFANLCTDTGANLASQTVRGLATYPG